MRALFLLLAALLLSGCGSELRTHPVAKSTTVIPRPTASPENPIVITGRELAAVDFSQTNPTSLTWQKGTENGGIIVTLFLENGVKATVQYNRIDGKVTCKTSEPRETIVSRVQEMDTIPSAAKLITEYDCTPA